MVFQLAAPTWSRLRSSFRWAEQWALCETDRGRLHVVCVLVLLSELKIFRSVFTSRIRPAVRNAPCVFGHMHGDESNAFLSRLKKPKRNFVMWLRYHPCSVLMIRVTAVGSQIKTFEGRGAREGGHISAPNRSCQAWKETFGHGRLGGLLRVSEAPYLATTTAVIL